MFHRKPDKGEGSEASEGCEGLSPLEGKRAGGQVWEGQGQAVVGTEVQRQCWGGSVWRASGVQLPCLLLKDTGQEQAGFHLYCDGRYEIWRLLCSLFL